MASGRGNNANLNGADPNNRRRHADAADLVERQEVAIREFQERQ